MADTRFKVWKVMALSVVCGLSILIASGSPVRTVSLVTDPACGVAPRHGLDQLKDAFRRKGFTVEETRSPETATGAILIVSGLARGNGPAVRFLQDAKTALPAGPEALAVLRTTWKAKDLLVLCGADDTGLMYAALDTADRIGWSSGPDDVFGRVKSLAEKPDLVDRSISIYTMQRAYFESRLYDEAYWDAYFDMLARSRFNSFVVVFGYENGGFMAPPYPYFFDVDGFPDVRLVGHTPEAQARNLEAFRKLIRIAHAHGIRFTAGIWDHIYRGGVQSGGVPGVDKIPAAPTPGLVWGLTADNLSAYSQAAIKKFIQVFPDIDALQFRMHSESGLKNEEIVGFWHDIFAMIKATRPGIRIDVRAKELPDEVIADGLDQGIPLRVTTKFWMEQMGLPFHPTHINVQDQKNRRHGYADLLRFPRGYKVHWRLWNGGTARILLWGDPDYVKTFVRSAHLSGGDSFEVNEPLATKMLAQPHNQAPFELLNPKFKYYTREFERYWHFFQVFGRLAYNPATPDEVWEEEFAARFGREAGPLLAKGLHLASRVLPRIVTAVYPYGYFPTTVGWPEKMRLKDLPEFAKAQGSDIQQFANFEEEAARLLAGGENPKRSPGATARWFYRISAEITELLTETARRIPDKQNKEFLSTKTDLEILAHLAQYYARRIPAAVSYALFVKSRDINAFDDAIAHEKNAASAWEGLVAAAGSVYTDDLMMGNRRYGLSGHWRDELAALKKGIEALEQERRSFRPAAGKGGPSIAHVPVWAKAPGEPLSIKATVWGSAPLAQINLVLVSGTGKRRTVAMTSAGDFRYQVQIPSPVGEEPTSYLIEAMDTAGAVATFPPGGGGETIRIMDSVDRDPPAVEHTPVTSATAGEPLRVTLRADDSSGVKWIRLRYRHVTQFEDYQTIEMTKDPRSGLYSALIPGDFIVPRWDLMYFIEAMDSLGNGAIYPDLDREIPYVIVPLRR